MNQVGGREPGCIGPSVPKGCTPECCSKVANQSDRVMTGTRPPGLIPASGMRMSHKWRSTQPRHTWGSSVFLPGTIAIANNCKVTNRLESRAPRRCSYKPRIYSSYCTRGFWISGWRHWRGCEPRDDRAGRRLL